MPPPLLELLWKEIFPVLYIDYDIGQDFMPQFRAALERITELMKRMLGLLKAQGYTKSSLAVQKTNTAAVKMYGRVGFETVSEKESEYIMLCRL